MAVNFVQIQRWTKMLTGKSVEHVNQNIGKIFSTSELKGYYNDLTEKVNIDTALLYNDNLPIIKQIDGQSIYFPVAIFQYALGCYDLWLLEGTDIYRRKFMQCVEWIYKHQDLAGRWDNFSYVYPDAPYGAMAQGEAVSVLLRAYKLTNNELYFTAAKKGIDFMLLDIKKGGTSQYLESDIIFWEYTNQPVVMNGWIFAWWGLYDYVLISKDQSWYKEVLDKSLNTLIKNLSRFKNTYWSLYDYDKKLASPFYHNLHIAQMEAMYKLTNQEIFNQYAIRWKKQKENPFNISLAFLIKAIQKIKE